MRTVKSGGWISLWIRLLSAAAIAGLIVPPAPSRAAQLHLSSRTYLLYFERDLPGGETRTFAPFYEYLSADAGELGGQPVSFHFYGWGRQDLGDDTGTGSRTGELGSAYLEYRHPAGNGEVRVGRFFLAEGTAAEILDGAFLKVRTGPGVGVSLFGGIPVERSIVDADTGDSLYGGRIFYVRPGVLEAGVGYLRESGTFQGDDRETVGGDLWLRPGIPAELSARAVYNVSTGALATQRYFLRVSPVARLDLSLGYEEYKYKDLFQTALHPAFLAPTIDNSDQVRTISAVADLALTERVTLEGEVKNLRHDLADPGDATKAGLGVRVAYNGGKDLGGISAALVSADRDENEYQEFRAFGSYTREPFRFTVDALTHRYRQAPGGSTIEDEYQVVGTAGWQPLPWLRLSADLTYTRSPQFSEDYAGLLRVAIDLDKEIRMPVPAKRAAAPAAPAKPSPAKVPPKAPTPPKPPAAKPAPPPAKAPETVASYLDRMGGEIRAKFPDAHVEREGEILDFRLPSDLVFDSGQSEVKPSARASVAEIAGILKKFPGTLVTVEGHTDSTGDPEFNQALSEKRARGVFDLLAREGISPLRISIRGYGEKAPVADNGTPEGRRKNRRVELKFRPDRALKQRLGQGR
ncbi:MAG: hypothetical protein Kow00128_22350 [Deltaproteobacteria bacterium]